MYQAILLVLAALVATGSYFYATRPVALFDALVPYDSGAVQIVASARYGDDPRQTLDVYAPRKTQDAAPILVFFYGGSWNDGAKADYGFAGSAFAAQGFVTVVPDYRLFPQVKYPDFLADGAAAIGWARANAAAIGGDPDRIVLAGHSAGAYNAAMLALDPQWLAGAGVPWQAVAGWAGLSGPYDFLPLDDPATIRTFGHMKDLAPTQPVNHASAGAPPAFLASGRDDVTVSPRHTVELTRRLRARGVSVEQKLYAGIGHAGLVTALSRPLRHRAPVLEDAARFLMARAGNRHLLPVSGGARR